MLNPDEAELRAREAALGHSNRFRKVATGYPHAVALAYDRDLEAAAAASDEEVAARVAAWEQEEGIEPRDWQAIGAEERDPEADALIDAWLEGEK
jgi:hypothetical protein